MKTSVRADRTSKALIGYYRDFVDENGRQPTMKEFKQYIHCGDSTIANLFGSYERLVRSAGYEPLPRSVKQWKKKKRARVKKISAQAVYVNYEKRYPVKYGSTCTLLKWVHRRYGQEKLS